MDQLVDACGALWDQLGWMTKVGLLAHSATVGLLVAAFRKPTRALVVLALTGSVMSLVGTPLTEVFLVEYEECGALEPPSWCASP